MKVLQIMGGREVGGAETAFADTVRALHNSGLHQHAIIREGTPCEALFRETGVPVTTLPFRKPFDWKTRPGIFAALMYVPAHSDRSLTFSCSHFELRQV